MVFANVKTLIMLRSFLEQVHEWLWQTWCQQRRHWWWHLTCINTIQQMNTSKQRCSTCSHYSHMHPSIKIYAAVSMSFKVSIMASVIKTLCLLYKLAERQSNRHVKAEQKQCKKW